ncbi:hypothetical protein B484DRAFT_403282 [Ochromonadaceae sp. CCMP2298]|nr:hypothetical protein B484DRAFT_403282 [Ochromonadaceae sp. CCMP2298]
MLCFWLLAIRSPLAATAFRSAYPRYPTFPVLRGASAVRRFSTTLPDIEISNAGASMSKGTKDPAFRLLLDDCKALNQPRQDISQAFALLDQEHTVPFIARYRREQTGDLPVEALYELQRRWTDFVATLKLRDSRLKTLEAAGKCTAEVRAQFAGCVSKEELDELYAGLKETRTAKSQLVAAFGLEQAALQLLSGEVRHVVVSQQAASAAAADKHSAFDALVYLCAAGIAGDAEVLAAAKEAAARFPGSLTTSLTPPYKALLKEREGGAKKEGRDDKGAKLSELDRFRDYHALQRRIPALAAHQVLAVRRAKDAGVLTISQLPDESAKRNLAAFVSKKYNDYPQQGSSSSSSSSSSNSAVGSKMGRSEVMGAASREAVIKLCGALAKKQWRDAISGAEVEAAKVFASSLRPLLLTAPLRLASGMGSAWGGGGAGRQQPLVVCAVDPGFSNGHKWVILDATVADGGVGVDETGSKGAVLSYGKIFEGKFGGGGGGKLRAGAAGPHVLQKPSDLAHLLGEHAVQVVAVGNGSGSREAQVFVAQALQQLWQGSAGPAAGQGPFTASAITAAAGSKRKSGEEGAAPAGKKAKVSGPFSADFSSSASSSASSSSAAASSSSGSVCQGYVVVSEAGASVYSASERGRQEFPPALLDIAFLGAVSIGRRLADPLSELVKVEPHSLGVGMYQHDLTDKGIKQRLGEVVEDCVNLVGADLNTASADLLHYVSGLNDANVREIIAARSGGSGKSSSKSKSIGGSGGGFDSLAGLLAVKGVGAKTFQNCAGFLRVRGGSEPLDASNVHPEDYPLARRMLALHTKGKLPPLHEEAAAETLGKSAAGRSAGALQQVWQWLLEAGLVPGEQAGTGVGGTVGHYYTSAPKVLRSTPLDLHTDLKAGSEVTGTVRNVTTFGAFVDLGGAVTSGGGKHSDGLLHCSKYRQHGAGAVYVGREVRVRVVSVEGGDDKGKGDKSRARISLELLQLL